MLRSLKAAACVYGILDCSRYGSLPQMKSSWVAAERLDFSFEWSYHQLYVKLGRQAKCGHLVNSFSLLHFLLGQPGHSQGCWSGVGWRGPGKQRPFCRGQHSDFASVSCLTGVPALSGGSSEEEGKNYPDHSATSEFRTQGLVCKWERERLWAPASALGKRTKWPCTFLPMCAYMRVHVYVRTCSELCGF